MDDLWNSTKQLVVIHLSDIHFGAGVHRFNPPNTATGDQPREEEYPTLFGKLMEDLREPDPGCPVIICITGDVVQTAAIEEFSNFEQFLRNLADAPVFGRARTMQNVFVVPGNHDVKYDSADIGTRWQQWTEFSRRILSIDAKREDPWAFARVYDRSSDLGAIIACLNSSIYVEKGKPDEDRGRLDEKQLTEIEEQLEAIDAKALRESIRVALIHHHPVLLPTLAEPGRGYDSVHNSGFLLSMLRRFGFHVVLHGHKHSPHTFTDDTRPAHQVTLDHTILIAAGGSAGSTGLPNLPGMTNCYNRITIKWHPDGQQSRIRVETRGLDMFYPDRTQRLTTSWKWYTMRIDDRHFYGFNHTPTLQDYRERNFDKTFDGAFDDERIQEYKRTRGNLPVVQVLPSLVPGQAYEAVLWIEPHPIDQQKPERDIPTQVTWSAGKTNDVVTVTREQHKFYCGRMTYWGPMLIQARITFQDNSTICAYVYARLPRAFDSGQ